jgi:hypothetical protein
VSSIIDALAHLVERELRSRVERGLRGDIMERSIASKPLGGGIVAPLTTSSTVVGNNFFGQPSLFSNPFARTPFQIESLPADVYTVHLSLLGLPDPYVDNGIALSTEAEVVFSVGGHQSLRRVSVNQGVRICGQADAVSVRVRDNSVPAISGEIPVTFAYNVDIAVSRGVRPDQQQPPTLAPTDNLGFVVTGQAQLLAPAGSLTFNVPQGVGIISTNCTVWTSPAGGAITEGQVFVEYLSNAAVLRAFDPRVMPWVPIVPGTSKVTINNGTASNVQFSLLYGIDG